MPNSGLRHQNEDMERIHASYIQSLPIHYHFHPQIFLKDIQRFHSDWFYGE